MTPSIEQMIDKGLKPGDTVKLRLRNQGAESNPPTSFGFPLQGANIFNVIYDIQDWIDTRTGLTKVFPVNYPPDAVFEGISEKGKAELIEKEGKNPDENGSEFPFKVDPKFDKFEGFWPSEKTTSQ